MLACRGILARQARATGSVLAVALAHGARQPGTIKLLIANDATEEELVVATDAFLRFIESLYVGQPVALRYHGGVAIVTYDAGTNAVRAVDLNEP